MLIYCNSLYKRNKQISLLCILLLATVLLVFTGSIAFAQSNTQTVEEVRTLFPSEWDVPNPVGLSYSYTFNQFLVLDDRNAGRPISARSTVVALTPLEDLMDMKEIEFGVDDASNMAFDDKGKRAFLLNGEQAKLEQIGVDADGRLDPTKRHRHDVARFGLKKARGMAVDSAGKYLFILDRDGKTVVRLTLDNESGLDNAEMVKIDVSALNETNLQGITVNPDNDHIYLLSAKKQLLFELTPEGKLVNSFDLSSLELADVRGIAFAPSTDLTDAAETTHLFITDRGPKNNKKFGKIVEVSLQKRSRSTPRTTTMEVTLFLVRTTDMSAFDPPSPDPAGVAYLPDLDHLLASDSEVNETPLFEDVNLFEMTLTGVLTETGETVEGSVNYSNEPTGVGFNPANDHFFISDDNTDKIFEVDPGSDSLYGTSDDSVVTLFSTRAFTSFDPEGVTFDTISGDLFIADGTNNEVYRVDDGPNGIFDGVPSEGGDDVVTNFDTLILGIKDPEGIHHDADSGNLIIVAKSETEMYEVTTGGSMVRTFDTSVADADEPAGVTIAPSSVDGSTMNYYVVDRGVDNNEDPDENDGKMYEFSLVSPSGLYVSSTSNGSAGGVSFKDEDILVHDPTAGTWAIYFDGSDVGITGDINAFALLDDDSILLSPNAAVTIGALGLVDDSDIVRFVPTSIGSTTAGTFEWYLDGSDVGLTSNGEDIDAISVLSDGRILVSTVGTPIITGTSGLRDEDLLAFTPTLTGTTTTGTWALYFDGSDVGLTTSNEDTYGASSITPDGDIYLTPRGTFAVTGASGDGADILLCTPITLGTSTSCTFTLFWDGSANGFAGEVADGIVVNSGTATRSIMATPLNGDNLEEEEDAQEEGDGLDENDLDEDELELFLPFVIR